MIEKFTSNDKAYFIEITTPAILTAIISLSLNWDILYASKCDELFIARGIFMAMSLIILLLAFWLRPASFSLEKKQGKLILITSKLWPINHAEVKHIKQKIYVIRLFKINRWYILIKLNYGWIAFSYWTESQAKSVHRKILNMIKQQPSNHPRANQ